MLVETEKGERMANQIEGYNCLECLVKTNDGVKEVFKSATWAALQAKKKFLHCAVNELIIT